jgi:flagellar motor switch/type III secretory pathway protein FliN
VVSSQYTSAFSNSINYTYYWFQSIFTSKIKESIKDFLWSDINLKLVGVTEQDNVFFAGEEYFVTRIKVDKRNEVFLRISTPLIDLVLEYALGKMPNNEVFSADKITELEATILTKLSDSILQNFSSFLNKDKEITAETNLNTVHLTYVVANRRGELGKLIISIPIDMLPPLNHIQRKQNFDLGSFANYTVPVKIITGGSQITFYDVQHIEAGDIVVLEKSNIKTMVISFNGQEKPFFINPETSIITGVDDDSEGEEMENNANKAGTMWDVIPVDITAEFEKVTITLGELKQISEGVIVDVGALYENKIVLKVENKAVASGELIIINDKYAVRVDEVYSDLQQNQVPVEKEAQQKQPVQNQQPKQQVPPQPQQQGEADPDFNYDDFDIEDEDI